MKNILALFCLLLTFAVPVYAADPASVPKSPDVTAEYEPCLVFIRLLTVNDITNIYNKGRKYE